MQLPNLSSLCTIRMNSGDSGPNGNEEQMWFMSSEEEEGGEEDGEPTPDAVARNKRREKRANTIETAERLKRSAQEKEDDEEKRKRMVEMQAREAMAPGPPSDDMQKRAQELDDVLNDADDQPVYSQSAAPPAAAAPAAAAGMSVADMKNKIAELKRQNAYWSNADHAYELLRHNEKRIAELEALIDRAEDPAAAAKDTRKPLWADTDVYFFLKP